MMQIHLLISLLLNASRLRALGPEERNFITVAIIKSYLDAVEELIAPAGCTRIAAMPRDILLYVLRPYLWVGDRLCDIKHRNGYYCGVQHGVVIDSFGNVEYRCYGLLHRVGAPAVIHNNGQVIEYYQNGRHFRESGPEYVMRTAIRYNRGRNWKYLIHETTYDRIDINKQLTVMRFTSGQVRIMFWARGTGIPIIIETGKLSTPPKVFISTHLFDYIVATLGEYVAARDVPGEIAREWARAQAEIANS